MTPKPTRRKGTVATATEDAADPARAGRKTGRKPRDKSASKPRASKAAEAGPQGAVAPRKRRSKPAGKVPPLPPKGHDVDPETLAFIAAIDAYKTAHSRPFPGWSEILHVARWLGYRKPDA